MKVRRTGSTAGFCLLLILSVAWTIACLSGRKSTLHNSNVDAMERYTSTYAYVLDEQRWCSFPLPEGKKLIKIVTNANLGAGAPPDEGELFDYAIRYQGLSSSNEVLLDRCYYFKSKTMHSFDAEVGAFLPAQRYATNELTPLSSKIAMLSLKEAPGKIDVLRLRLQSRDPDLQDVGVRLYHQDEPPRYKLRYLWQRLAAADKQHLARFNVYSDELLTKQETTNLLTGRWVALAPSGIEGRDYWQRKLYGVTEQAARSEDEPIWPDGLYIAPGLRGAVPLPLSTHVTLWELLPADEGTEFEAGDRALVTWWNPDERRKRRFSLELAGAKSRQVLELNGGIAEVEAERELVVRIYAVRGQDEIEITPREELVPACVLEWPLELDYALAGGSGDATPFRVDLRQVLLPGDKPEASASTAVRFTVFGGNGERLAGGELAHQGAASLYDLPLGGLADCRVSDPSHHYLSLPASAHKLRLTCSQKSILVSAYTRPEGLRRRVRVPEDYDPFAKDHDGLTPTARHNRAWFLVRPLDTARWMELNQTAIVKVRTSRPRVDDDDAAAEPAGRMLAAASRESSPARQVLALAGRAATWGDEASEGRLIKLPAALSQSLFFGELRGPMSVRPRLLVLRERALSEPLILLVDGKPYHEQALSTPTTEAALPPLSSGWHEVQCIAPEGASAFISHAEPEQVESAASAESTESWVKRTAYPLEDGLAFSVRKSTTEEEMLSCRLYLPASRHGRVRLLARLSLSRQSGVPFRSWTFPAVELDIAPPETAGLPLLFSETTAGKTALLGERLFFLPLSADVTPGEYTVRFTLVTGPRCLLHLSQRVPASGEKRRVFLEEGIPTSAAVEKLRALAPAGSLPGPPTGAKAPEAPGG